MATAAITGTVTESVNESAIVAGAKTLIITLTGDTWRAAGSSCNYTGGGLFSDKFENTNDIVWTQSGGATWSFVSEARGSCSSYFLRTTNPASGDRQTYTISPAAVAYVEGWFRIKVDGLADAATMDIVRLNTADPFLISNIRITKTGAQLSVAPVDHLTSTYTSQNISADTWYHVGLYWNNTANSASWYLSTADALGSAIDTVSPATSRSFGQLVVGRISGTGTIGNTTLDYDSWSADASGFVPIENPI